MEYISQVVVKRRIQELILEIRVFIPPSPLPLLVHASIINRTAIPKEYNSLILKHPQVGFDLLFIILFSIEKKKKKVLRVKFIRIIFSLPPPNSACQSWKNKYLGLECLSLSLSLSLSASIYIYVYIYLDRCTRNEG